MKKDREEEYGKTERTDSNGRLHRYHSGYTDPHTWAPTSSLGVTGTRKHTESSVIRGSVSDEGEAEEEEEETERRDTAGTHRL